MGKREEILKKCTTNKWGFRTSSEDQQLQAMQEYSDLTNAKLVEENEKQIIFIDKCSNELGQLQSELSASKERVKELKLEIKKLTDRLAIQNNTSCTKDKQHG